MKFPNNFRQFLPTEAIKQISQIINNPKLSEAFKDAAEKAGFKDALNSANLQPIQQVVDNASKWMESLAKHFSYFDESERVREGINATGELFSSRWLGIPLSPQQSLQLASSIRGVTDGTNLNEELNRLVCQMTGAHDAMFVNSALAGLFAVVAAVNQKNAANAWVLPRENCIRIPRFGDSSAASIPDSLAAARVKVVEVGTTNDCDLQELLNVLQDDKLYAISVSSPRDMPESSELETNPTTRKTLLEAKAIQRFQMVEIVMDAALVNLQPKLGFGKSIDQIWNEGVDIAIVPCEYLIGASEGCMILFREHSEIVTAVRAQISASGSESSALSKRLLFSVLSTTATVEAWEQSEIGQILFTTPENLLYRAQKIAKQLESSPLVKSLETSLKPCRLGTGAWSEARLPSGCVRIYPKHGTPKELAVRLASGQRPLWCNVHSEFIELILRTMTPEDDLEVIQCFCDPAVEPDVRTESGS